MSTSTNQNQSCPLIFSKQVKRGMLCIKGRTPRIPSHRQGLLPFFPVFKKTADAILLHVCLACLHVYFKQSASYRSSSELVVSLVLQAVHLGVCLFSGVILYFLPHLVESFHFLLISWIVCNCLSDKTLLTLVLYSCFSSASLDFVISKDVSTSACLRDFQSTVSSDYLNLVTHCQITDSLVVQTSDFGII